MLASSPSAEPEGGERMSVIAACPLLGSQDAQGDHVGRRHPRSGVVGVQGKSLAHVADAFSISVGNAVSKLSKPAGVGIGRKEGFKPTGFASGFSPGVEPRAVWNSLTLIAVNKLHTVPGVILQLSTQRNKATSNV